MFGLEDDKKKKPTQDFSFDFEEEIKDPAKRRALVEKIHQRIAKLKEILNAGVDKEDIGRISVLLQSYSSLFKVVNRKPRMKFK